MVTAIISGLLILGLTALGFLSYNHFESFSKIAYRLLWGTGIILVCCCFWNSLIEILKNKITLELYKHYDKSIIAEIDEYISTTFNSYHINYWTLFIGYILVALILSILYFSPYYIKDHPYNKK
jgi:Sec-independent protein secretion pathway component TatC